jgi:hypothetical protein
MVRALLLLHRHGQDSKNRCAYFSQDELLYRRTFPCCWSHCVILLMRTRCPFTSTSWGEDMPRVKQMIAILSLIGYVGLKGYVTGKEPESLYEQADAFCHDVNP